MPACMPAPAPRLHQRTPPAAAQAGFCTLNMATPAPEARSFAFMCGLQPFLDARLVEALLRAAAAATAGS